MSDLTLHLIQIGLPRPAVGLRALGRGRHARATSSPAAASSRQAAQAAPAASPPAKAPAKPGKTPPGRAAGRQPGTSRSGAALRGTDDPARLDPTQSRLGPRAATTPSCSTTTTLGRHARLRPHEGAWLVEDLGSTNGTYLDSRKVTGPMVVPIGVPVRIGKTVLELRK